MDTKTKRNFFCKSGRLLALLFLSLIAVLTAHAQESRFVDPADDEKLLPYDGHVLTDRGDAQIVRFRNWDRFNPVREIRAGNYILALPKVEFDWSDFSYVVNGKEYTIEDYMVKNHTGGLLVIKNGQSLLERYAMGNDEQTLWISFSMSKSVTSMLLGAAIADGYIRSADDAVSDYLPRLRGSSYDDVRLRDLLHMASGIEWNEDYTDLESDVATYPSDRVIDIQRYLGTKPRVAPAGELFNYSTAETDLVGAIVRAAIGNNLATYLENKIWKPFGMEFDANWSTHGDEGERGGCCMNVTLRDYGRIGLFALNEGVLPDGSRMLPEGWMVQSSTPSSANPGYGYLWWLNNDDSYRAQGIFGQGIYVKPESELVIVVLSAWPVAAAGGSIYNEHRNAFYDAVEAILQ
ncbi:MAG: serine hydrolase [Gammaproteobacteria bacterium]|nr:serine hydrolase [Gammaproteobacteria bacterium]